MTLVDRLARRLAGDRVGRRGFLADVAIAGSAAVVAPRQFLLKPVDAYTAVCTCRQGCPCGSLCCDGYTEFCCSIYGENRCPPGAVTGGWWKVDSSSFCSEGGDVRPRYYLDCHNQCGPCACGSSGTCSGECSGTSCGCALGRCDLRKAGCTRFRYGQCNQQLACIGPIICRLVTCLPPWQLDAACTTATLTDERTRFHDAPCLHVGFSDVLDDAFYTPAVAWAVDRGITTGVGGGDLFFPDRPVTRAELVTFVWRFWDRPRPAAPTTFTDVELAYYYDAVSWAQASGLTTGVGGSDRFAPDAPTTRAETVTFLWRMLGSPTAPDGVPFSDLVIPSFYDAPVRWAASVGVTTGVGDTGRFFPDEPVTRAQAVTFLWRIAGDPSLFGELEPPSTVRFPR